MQPSIGGISMAHGAVNSERQYKVPVSRSKCRVSASASAPMGGGEGLRSISVLWTTHCAEYFFLDDEHISKDFK